MAAPAKNLTGDIERIDIGKPFFLSGGIEPGDENKLSNICSGDPVAKATVCG